MAKKLVLVFAILALAVAFGGTVPVPGGNYRITLTQPSVVKGIELKHGEYKVSVAADKVTIDNGKQTVKSAVNVDLVEKKFDTTSIRYNTEAGKQTIVQIRIG